MERKWTKAQLAAMETRGKTLLVSAAAGSGKTATLTERIIRKIIDKEAPADISKMVIVTFTRAAAAELRSKIFTALSNALTADPSNRHLTSQLMKVGSAKICTIDSFYLDIIKENFPVLGLPASFRIADDSEYLLIARKAMEQSIEEMYATDNDFPTFTECFGTVRSAGRITDIMLSMHDRLSVIPDGTEYISKLAKRVEENSDNDFFSTSYGETIRKNTIDFFEYYESIFSSAIGYIETEEAVKKAYINSFSYDLEFCRNAIPALNDRKHGYTHAQTLLRSYSPVSLSSLSSKNKTEYSEKYKKIRSEFTAKVRNLASDTFSKSPQMISRAMRDTAKQLKIMYKLLAIFEQRVGEAKSRLSLMTFSDVRRYTLRLLVNDDGTPTEIAKKYSERYEEIYIDEYQDVDRVQDLIFKSISQTKNRFMVGDIKQSIYGFRGAEPMLFAEYRHAFPALEQSGNSEEATIFMSNNYRCDENIIKFANSVCATTFSACTESIGYTSNDDLIFSKAKVCDDYVSPKVKVSVINPPDDDPEAEKDSDTRKMWEAKYIATEISGLVNNGTKADGTPIFPGDIAILFRSKSMLPYLRDALDDAGIMYSQQDDDEYFENPDVLMMLCILNTIDNPERDIYLAGTLRSPIFGFNMEDLISVRRHISEAYSLFGALCDCAKEDTALSKKCRDFLELLAVWQSDASALPIDRFLLTLFESERFTASGIVSQTDEKGEGGNLLILYEYARKFESGGFKGLYQFLEYINSVIDNNGKIAGENKKTSTDRVSLMTIHKSKGLEFPVCFICNSNASVRPQDITNSMVLDFDAGIALKIADGSGLARINTPMRDAVISTIYNKQLEEEMRILYVALTRARERLYVTASTSYSTDKLIEKSETNADFLSRYTIMNKCSSYLDWILLAASKEQNDSYEILSLPANHITDFCSKKAPLNTTIAVEDPELVNRLADNFSFRYKFLPLSRVPSKLSVSKLYPGILDENDDTLELFTCEEKSSVPDFFLTNSPAKSTAAERGTATHLFLQFCDFTLASKTGADEELKRLEEKKFLPPNAASLIYMDEIRAFMRSELISKILSASEIIREQRFNVKLPIENFSSDPELIEKMSCETLAIQGVIDLILIDNDGNISLVDYKTDRLSAAELADKKLAARRMNEVHGKQLSYYASAIKILFGKSVRSTYVYSTHSSELYEINVRQ